MKQLPSKGLPKGQLFEEMQAARMIFVKITKTLDDNLVKTNAKTRMLNFSSTRICLFRYFSCC